MSGVWRGGRPVVEVGAQVRFSGVRWQVVALSRQGYHLVDESGADQVVLAGHLFADPGFAVLGSEPVQAVPQWGLFETAPVAAREKAMAWLRHIREVECGLPGGPDSDGVMRAEYDPQRWTLAERERAKAAELTALGFARVSEKTVQKMRLAYRKQGLWGLVDHRSTRGRSGGGRQDERIVAAIKEVLHGQRGRSKGTVKGLMPLVARLLEDRHKGVVAMPSRATFYRLVHEIAHPADHPATRVRTAPVNDDGRGFTPTVASRPGEQVQIDTTRLDVLARFDDGSVGRPELTIAVDVASRAILAGVLCPSGTQAVDAALLLADMAVPHPARPAWPEVLRFDHSTVLPAERLLSLDERLRGAAARPVVVPETVVVDRGKVFLSKAFTGACEALGISVQAAPPFAPTAKGIVERTFGSINTLFCQHLPGYTGSDVTRRGKDAAREATYSVTELQELLDEWLVHYHHRPHQGLRHPMLPKIALSPNQMWAALVAVAGYEPVPLTGNDYLELLPVRWQAITEHGIRLNHRTYDHDLLGPHRGQLSPVAGRGGKWEIHYNPHDVRHVWIRLPDGQLTEIPWIHRDHAHQPFNDRIWQYLRTITGQRAGQDADQAEAALAEALDALMRRARAGQSTTEEQHILNRTATVRTPPPRRSESRYQAPQPQPGATCTGKDGLDGLDQDQETEGLTAEDETVDGPAAPVSGYGLYDAEEEALKW